MASVTPKKNQDKGTGNLVGGAGLTAYGAANAPVLRAGYKDKSKMGSASPKKQASRYQAELHEAMQSGKVSSDSPVNVLRTPSGRHINAGGTHRHIAREAMGKPSQYNIKDISHEIHVSPYMKAKGKLQVAGLARGSKRAEAGKKVKPVGTVARFHNKELAHAADMGDARIWSNPAALEAPAKLGRKVGLIGAGVIAGAGALDTAVGLHQRNKWKKQNVKTGMSGVKKMDSTSAFGVDHAISKASVDPDTGKKASAGRRILASAPGTATFHPIVAGKKGKKFRATANQWGGSFLGATAGQAAGAIVTRGRSAGGIAGGLAGGVAGSQTGLSYNQRKGYLKAQ